MTVTDMNRRTRARRPARAEVEAVQAQPSQAAQVRYACEHMDAPLTPERIRTWLEDRGVTVGRRESVSRAMNAWKNANGQPVTPPRGISLSQITPDVTRDVTPPVTPEVTPEPTEIVMPHAPEVTTDHATARVTTEPPADLSVDTLTVTRDRTMVVTPGGTVPVTPEITPPVTRQDTVTVTPEVTPPAAPAGTVAVTVTAPVTVDVRDHAPVITTDHVMVTRDRLAAPAAPAALETAAAPVTASVTASVTPEQSAALVKRSKRLRTASHIVLSLVAAAGAVLSYQSLEQAAAEIFPVALAYVFPLLVDALIVGASLAYMAGATVGRGRAGWRLTAHGGVAGTIALNALAAESLASIPWHVAAPIVWSVIVELTARDLLGDHRQTVARPDSLPPVLWLTAPRETAATWLRVRRQAAHAAARSDVGRHEAAIEALRLTLPGREGRQARRIIGRQLRSGSITPAAVVAIMDDPTATPRTVLRAVLTAATAVPKGAAPTL